MLLFANYKTISVATDDSGKKHKAKGGKRVMYTAHHPCWDAKNRHGLADELPFDYGQIAHCIPILGTAPQPAPKQEAFPPEPIPPVGAPAPQNYAKEQEPMPAAAASVPEAKTAESSSAVALDDRQQAMKALQDLMDKDGINRLQIQKAVGQRGYYTADTPIENYTLDFIKGVVIGAWDQLVDHILNDEVPF